MNKTSPAALQVEQSEELLAAALSCSPERVDEFLQEDRAWRGALRSNGLHARARIAVVGAGVIGLSIATTLDELGYEVTVYCDSPLLETTSVSAAGLIEPVAPPEGEQGRELFLRAFYYSYRAWAALVRGQQEPLVMLRRVTGYWRQPGEPEPWTSLVDSFQVLEASSLPQPYRRGEQFLTYVVDTRQWILAAATHLLRNGVKIVPQYIQDPRLLLPEFDALVNATGMSAALFSNDPTVYPVDGHVLTVPRPKDFNEVVFDWDYDGDEDGPVNFLYAISRARDVVLGGTLIMGRRPQDGEPHTEANIGSRIYEAVTTLVPQLKGLPVEEYRACSRPNRPTVRLEIETIDTTPILHCYGTGGSGWTTAPGLARYGVQMLAEHIPPPA